MPVVIKDMGRAWDCDREDVVLREIFADMMRLWRKMLRSIFSLFLMPAT